MKKELKLGQYVLLSQIIPGVSWLIVGMLNCFPVYRATDVFKSVIMIISLISTTVALILKREKTDEMGREHFGEAYSFGYSCLIIFLAICAIIYILWKFLKAEILFPFSISVGFLSAGIKFLALERNNADA